VSTVTTLTPTSPTSPTSNKAVVQRFYDEVLNQGRLEVVEELATPDCVTHSPVPSPDAAAALRGPEGLKATAVQVRTRFPDVRFAIEDMVAEHDRVAVRWTLRGTNTGDYPGFPPATGRRAEVGAIVIYRLEGGRLAELWPMIDLLGMVRQLGVTPPGVPGGPGGPAPAGSN
jgi:steroid delta-isomerase-like uncharacterized protein